MILCWSEGCAGFRMRLKHIETTHVCKVGMGRWSLQSRHLCKAKPWFQCVDCSASLSCLAKSPLACSGKRESEREVFCNFSTSLLCLLSFVFRASKVGWLKPLKFPSVVAYFSQANEQLQASRQSCLWPKFKLSSLQVEESMRCSMKVLILRKLQQFWSCFYFFPGHIEKDIERPTKNPQATCRYAGTPDDCMRILGDLVNGLDSHRV